MRKVVKRRNTMRKVVKRRNTKRRKSIKRRFSGGMPTQNEIMKEYIIKRYNDLKNAGTYDQDMYNRAIKQLDTLSETGVNKLYSSFISISGPWTWR